MYKIINKFACVKSHVSLNLCTSNYECNWTEATLLLGNKYRNCNITKFFLLENLHFYNKLNYTLFSIFSYQFFEFPIYILCWELIYMHSLPIEMTFCRLNFLILISIVVHCLAILRMKSSSMSWAKLSSNKLKYYTKQK